jgi:NADH dehydrogenase
MPHFQYYPALYDTATGHSHLESWVPLAKIFADAPNVEVVIDSIKHINPQTRILTSASGTKYHYETVVLALGTITTYFGIKGLDQYAYGIKSVAEINAFKRHLYQEMGKNHIVDKHYVVVGGGPTGVELAAALVTYLERLRKQFNLSGAKKIHIDLVEASPRVLPRMSEKASATVRKRLEALGVKVHTGKAVQSQNADTLMVSGKPISSHTVIWTSGVANNPFFKANEEHFQFAPNGRVIVDEFMQAHHNVYVIGDNAATKYTGFAQTALHDAVFVARNLRRIYHRKRRHAYKAVQPAVVVPVGENWAIFEWHKLRFAGWIGALFRRAADFIGYHDVLPIGQALGTWRASRIMDDDFETVPLQDRATEEV